MEHYFAIDGNYGDGTSIIVCNTDDWTSEMFLYISECYEYDRRNIAECFANGVTLEQVKEIYGE